MNTTPLLELLSHTAMKGAAVLLVALLLGLILRKTAASRRYAIWLTAIAALAVLPLAMWALPAWRVLPKASAGQEWPGFEPEVRTESEGAIVMVTGNRVPSPAAQAELQEPGPAAAPPSFSWPISWQDVVSKLPLVWMLIAGGFLLRLGLSAWCLHRLEATLTPGEFAVVAQTARELGLKRMPRLFVGPPDAVPMVWGVLRPRLLLPQGFESWSGEKQRGVLLHELAHLKRGDPLALWIAQWVKALHWFNPLAWLTLRQLRADQERACDDTVLRRGVRASDYAQSLLDLSRHNRLAPGLSLCALTITRCAPVEARVKAILDPSRRRDPLTVRWLAGLGGGALLITLPVAMLHAIEGTKLRGRILDRNGVVLAESTKEKVRSYPLKTLAAHVVGYTRRPDEKHGQYYGGAGFEKQQDATLAEGKDAALTLDMRIQALVHQAMKDGGVTRGAAVVLDPQTGEILASVSLPGYDPNLFVPSVSFQNWDRYFKDTDNPLLDRVSSARSAPGAVFQPFTALAALRAGKTPGTYACTPLTRGSGGGVRYGSVTRICRTSLREGAAHGPLTLEQALAKGCFSYFFQLGTEVGYPALFSMAEDLGLQQDTNIFGAKSPPLLPTMEELAKTRSSQRQLNDFITDFASGRGSPAAVLQMAALYSALTNGKVWEPSLTKKSDGRPRLDLNTLPGLPEGLARVRSALREAVIHPQPWARSLTSSKAQIAALADSYATGAKGPHSEVFTHHYWMAGYAPADKPTLAFALYVDETSPDSTLVPDKLGPMVRRVVEEMLALPADGSGEVQPVEDELSRAHDQQQQAQARFDAKAELLKAAIEGIKPDATTGFKLEEITVGSGQVVVRGVASSMTQALQFREALLSLKWEDELEWVSPVPQTLRDGKRVGFGVLGVLASNVKDATALEVVQASLASLNDPRSNTWQALRQLAGLAEIPGGRTALRGELGDTGVHFYLPRQEVAGWLRDSLGDDVDVQWLETEDAQSHGYQAKNGYQVEVSPSKSSGKVLKVTVKPQAKTIAAAGPAKFDFDAGETSRQIKALSAEAGILVKEFKMGQGKVSVLGEATGMTAARKYLFKLLEIGRERNVRWALPTTKVLGNQSVQFEASGVYGAAALADAPSDPKAAASLEPASKPQLPISDDVIRMQPELAKQWTHLKAAGLLADLPAEAVVLSSNTERLEQYVQRKQMLFRFSLPREAARRWLVDSIFVEDERERLLKWPKPPASFNGTFTAANNCTVIVSCQEGETVHMAILQPISQPQNKPDYSRPLRPFRPFLIAPDESQEPRPAGRLAPEYQVKGVSEGEALPALDATLQTLRPSILPQAARLPAFSPQSVQIRLQTSDSGAFSRIYDLPHPLNRFKGELSEESERAVRGSYLRSRLQQALVTKAPQGL